MKNPITLPPEPATPPATIATYLWLALTSAGILAVLTVPVVLAFSPTFQKRLNLLASKGLTFTHQSEVLSPVADEPSSPTITNPPVQSSSANVYSPTQYIYLSQSFFSDGQALSQNRQQSEEDKKVILTKLQQAIDTISEGIGKFPKRAELWAHRATIEWSIASAFPNALPNAISDMEEAAKLNPQNPDYTRALSDLYLAALRANSGNPENSRNLLDRAVYFLARTQEQKPNDPKILYNLAQLQTKAGLLKNARISFVKLLPLITDPTQKQQIESEKANVEKLLAQENASARQRISASTKENTDAIDAMTPSSPPSGLELTPDQQTMSRQLVVAAPGDTTSPYQDFIGSSAFSGTATISAGQTSITVEATRVTDTAPVYVTPMTTTNATLSVTTKKAGSHFTVSIDSPQPTDTPFQWWILSP